MAAIVIRICLLMFVLVIVAGTYFYRKTPKPLVLHVLEAFTIFTLSTLLGVVYFMIAIYNGMWSGYFIGSIYAVISYAHFISWLNFVEFRKALENVAYAIGVPVPGKSMCFTISFDNRRYIYFVEDYDIDPKTASEIGLILIKSSRWA